MNSKGGGLSKRKKENGSVLSPIKKKNLNRSLDRKMNLKKQKKRICLTP